MLHLKEEEFFDYILQDMILKIFPKEHPGIFFFVKNGEIWMEYNRVDNFFWVSHKIIWRVIREQFNMESELLKRTIEYNLRKHYGFENITVGCRTDLHQRRWDQILKHKQPEIDAHGNHISTFYYVLK